MNRRYLPAFALSIFVVGAGLTQVRDAAACGGCFHEPPRPNEVESVITDHRMVFSISQTQTVLWDQVRYVGDPTQFAWVLPVQPGAKIELSHDAFMAALDASTQPVVKGPTTRFCGGNGFGYNEGRSGGLGCGSSSDSAFGSAAPTGNLDSDSGTTPGVTVVSQDTVGPYEAVTLRASMGDALETWLTTNGFAIPASIQPTLTAYVNEGFDFIALKLRPGQGVRAMQPVRIVSRGADPSLPLRMVAAGVGANVGLELYVIGEGRYHTQNFPDAVIDFTKLTWDPAVSRSNFAQLEEAALTAGGGLGWITQSSAPASRYASVGNGTNPGLYSVYTSLCRPKVTTDPPCDAGAPTPLPDASSDAGEAGTIDGGPIEAGTHDAATCPPPSKPDVCDDLDVATAGMRGDIWVTRLRARLPAHALTVGELRLEATADQAQVSNVHATETYSDPKYDPCPATTNQSAPSSSSSGCSCNAMRDDDRFGTWFLLGFTAFGMTLLLRRRRS